MRITKEDYELFQQLVTEFYVAHPQLDEVHYDEEGRLFEYLDGYQTYDTYGPTTKRRINQLSDKLKSVL
ncbi:MULTISPECIES: hypothetical protein [Enterococcus]|uniref:hypothetical protein n=1 Tax=Enterococcus TaxID=1350 RepID=UPI0022E6F304|nr:MULTISPECIES: hypothetical protein [Enterococcus]